MRYEWDETKRLSNLTKHDLDFKDVSEAFKGPMLAKVDFRKDYGEPRWIGFGFIRKRLVAVVYTTRGPEMIRIISLRKASKHEQKQFKSAIKDQLEEG